MCLIRSGALAVLDPMVHTCYAETASLHNGLVGGRRAAVALDAGRFAPNGVGLGCLAPGPKWRLMWVPGPHIRLGCGELGPTCGLM